MSTSIPPELARRLDAIAISLDNQDPERARQFLVEHAIANLLNDVADPMGLVETARAYDARIPEPDNVLPLVS